MKYSFAQLEEIWIEGATKRGISKKEAVSRAPLMASISLAESAGEPESKPNYPDAKPEGLWQINGKPFEGNALNPVTNAEMAAEKLKSQGLDAWETYTNGDYKQFYTESNIKGAEGKVKNASEVEIIPGESKVPLLGPFGELLQEGGEAIGKLPQEGAEDAAKAGAEAAIGKGGTEFFESLTEPESWLRIAEGLGGLLLLYIALRQLSGRFEVGRTAIAQTREGKAITVRTHKRVQTGVAGTASLAREGGKGAAKAASKATQAPKRVKAAKSAHARSKKFGGTPAQARKAAANAARKPGK